MCRPQLRLKPALRDLEEHVRYQEEHYGPELARQHLDRIHKAVDMVWHLAAAADLRLRKAGKNRIWGDESALHVPSTQLPNAPKGQCFFKVRWPANLTI